MHDTERDRKKTSGDRSAEGPRPLFFSGGTALGAVASALTAHTANAVHVITTFDSGGSSAALREAFAMPAVGDVRARIMALADSRREGYSEAMALFRHRLPGTPKVLCQRPSERMSSGLMSSGQIPCPAEDEAFQHELLQTLQDMASGRHALMRGLPDEERSWACQHLETFLALRPPCLDLAGASIGNLILTAEYLQAGRKLGAAAQSLVLRSGARGNVIPVVEDSAHLCVRLENGEQIIGQHRFTGKSAGRITSPIRDLWLSASLDDPSPIELRISAELAACIGEADLICYPVGSFFSSVLANLLPQGVREAVRKAICPKLFIPNLGNDPELLGYSVQAQTAFLLERLLHEGPNLKPVSGPIAGPAESVLTALLIDKNEARYPGGIPHQWLHSLGIRVIRADLVTPASDPYLDAERVCRQIMALMEI